MRARQTIAAMASAVLLVVGLAMTAANPAEADQTWTEPPAASHTLGPTPPTPEETKDQKSRHTLPCK